MVCLLISWFFIETTQYPFPNLFDDKLSKIIEQQILKLITKDVDIESSDDVYRTVSQNCLSLLKNDGIWQWIFYFKGLNIFATC